LEPTARIPAVQGLPHPGLNLPIFQLPWKIDITKILADEKRIVGEQIRPISKARADILFALFTRFSFFSRQSIQGY